MSYDFYVGKAKLRKRLRRPLVKRQRALPHAVEAMKRGIDFLKHRIPR
jgi:hypothetical protein